MIIRKFIDEDYIHVLKFLNLVSDCICVHSYDDLNTLLTFKSFKPYVAIINDTIVGYIELHLLPHIARGFDGRIERVVVHSNYRNQNIATEMCKYVIQEAKNMNCYKINLTVSDHIAKHIYINKLKFQQIDINTLELRNF
jgi:GNAT superfamily N-acetyltransferase